MTHTNDPDTVYVVLDDTGRPFAARVDADAAERLAVEHEHVRAYDRRNEAPKGPRCAVCNGTGVDENLDPEKLTAAVQKCLERADELRAADDAERAHLEEAARILRMPFESTFDRQNRAEAMCKWREDDDRLRAERKRRSGQ